MEKTYNYIDLFAGASGLAEGFYNAIFNPIVHFAKVNYYNIHYDIQRCRSISDRDVTRIQSLPDDYIFKKQFPHNYRKFRVAA